MRACGPWECGPETYSLPGCRACWITRRPQRPLRQMGEERHVSGGVFDQGTHEEDGPGTWEALASPRHIPASRRAGDRLRRTTRLQGHVSSATRHRTSTCIEVGHWQGEPEPWLMGAGRRRAA